jgi:hypothetical protein
MASNLAVQAGSRFGNYQRRASGDVFDERFIESKTLILENPLFDEDSLGSKIIRPAAANSRIGVTAANNHSSHIAPHNSLGAR